MVSLLLQAGITSTFKIERFMTKINPFTPNNPVSVGMFAGRIKEIEELEKGLFQTKSGVPVNFLVTGERGIGKSSLMLYLKHASQSDLSLEYGAFNFVTISLSISDKMGLVTLIKLIERHISRELGKVEAVRTFLAETWGFVQRVKIMDSGITTEEKDAEAELMLDDFSYSLAETCLRIINPSKGEKKRDGILFIIDECDNASVDLRIGYFFKMVAENLQKNDCHNVMFVVAGLPDACEKISESHQSALRIFSQMKILPLIEKDSNFVVERGINQANEVNEVKVEIETEALQRIAGLSEGYPHFIQQFAYSAFESNVDSKITTADVLAGAFNPGGALDQIGARYYANAYFDKIKSDEYRQVLSIMAKKQNSWVKKSEIRAQFSGDDSTLSNALTALTSRKIILKNPSIIGEYRLQQKGFALWISLFGDQKKP
jgi:hypothetical protein